MRDYRVSNQGLKAPKYLNPVYCYERVRSWTSFLNKPNSSLHFCNFDLVFMTEVKVSANVMRNHFMRDLETFKSILTIVWRAVVHVLCKSQESRSRLIGRKKHVEGYRTKGWTR